MHSIDEMCSIRHTKKYVITYAEHLMGVYVCLRFYIDINFYTTVFNVH